MAVTYTELRGQLNCTQCKWLVFVCLAIVVLHIPDQLYAQFTDPRNYANTPVCVNQLELGYAYAHANSSFDTSLIVATAELNLNVGTIDYTRYFGFFHRTAWVEAKLPLGSLSGSVASANLRGSVTGTGDSSYGLGMLLKGGPALNVNQFESYTPTTSLGVSLTVTAPTGRYDPNKVLNLGSNRWSFKPEIGISHPFGPSQKWVVDAYANAYFYTDNTSYEGREILRQEALPGIEGHISYSFTSNLWAALDARYSFRGDSFIDGTDQHNAQRGLTLGSEVSISLSPRNMLVFEFAKALVHQNAPAYAGFALRYSYSWGKGYE